MPLNVISPGVTERMSRDHSETDEPIAVRIGPGLRLRLWLRRRIAEIDAALVRFERALLDQAEAHPEVMIPGYKIGRAHV